MAINRGKAFEEKFRTDWKKSFPKGLILRLPDQMNGYKSTGQNICDFLGFNIDRLYFIEVKSHYGNTFPLSKLTQYEKMLDVVGITGTRAGVVIWFMDHDKVVYVPISAITKMKADGKKSVHIKMLEDKLYNIIEIPSVKKRVFLESDYSILLNLEDGQ